MGRMERSIMRKLLLVFLLLCLTSIIINNAYSVELQPKAKVVEILDKIEQIEKEEDKVYWNKITTVKPKNAADQYCYVKVIIKESDNQLIKEEILLY
jgi:Na+-transporting NADH:ubiquinone oxidoreductase subunit NqrC